jgi:hypothetical protein
MFSAPFNYPQRACKGVVNIPYSNVGSDPYRKRDLLDEVMNDEISGPLEAEAIKPGLEDPLDIDCNECDIVVNDRVAATYMNPEYAYASSVAKGPESPVTTTSTTTLIEAVSIMLLPSRARLGAEVRKPIETSTLQADAR